MDDTAAVRHAQLLSNDDAVRIAALRTMTASELSPAVIVHVHAAVLSPCQHIRLAAIACWQRCTQGYDEVILQATHDRVDHIRAEAYFVALGWQMPNQDGCYQRGLCDRSACVRMAVLRAACHYRLDIPTMLLRDRLHDSDMHVACKAAEILAKRHDEVALDWLDVGFHGDDIPRKRLVIRALGHARVRQFVPLLMYEIQQHSPCMLCSIDALGFIAAPESVPLLLVLIADVRHDVRQAAINALRNVDDAAKVVPVMRQALSDHRRYVHIAAVSVLQAYEYTPTSAEFLVCARCVSHIPDAWIEPLVAGSCSDICQRLEELYTQGVTTACADFTQRIAKKLRLCTDRDAVVQVCLTSQNPELVLLGLRVLDGTHVHNWYDQIVVLTTHSDTQVRAYVTNIIRQYAHTDDALLRLAWQLSPAEYQKSLVPHLMRRDQSWRAWVWVSDACAVRMRVIAVLTADAHATGEILRQLHSEEITQLVAWQRDERVPNRIHIVDIVDAWRVLSPHTV